MIGNVLSNWANAELERGNEDQATVFLKKCLEFRRKPGDTVSLSNEYCSLGKISWHRHDLQHAKNFLREATTLRHDRGKTLGIVACLWAFGRMTHAEEQLERVVSLFGSIAASYKMLKTSVFNWTMTTDDLNIVDAKD